MTWDPPGLWASLILSISGGIVAGILVLVGEVALRRGYERVQRGKATKVIGQFFGRCPSLRAFAILPSILSLLYSPTLCPTVSCLSGKMRFVAGGRWVPPRCKKKPGYRRACRPCLEPGDRGCGGTSPASRRRGLHSLAGVVVRKGRNLLWISYTLYSGLLLLLGCRSAIHGAACYAEKATERHTDS